MRLCLSLCLVALAVSDTQLMAQPEGAGGNDVPRDAGLRVDKLPPPIRLTLHPANTSVPLLRHELLPNFRDILPGNAALSYHRASLLVAERRYPDPKQRYELEMRLDESLQKPLKELPIADFRNEVMSFRAVLRELETGARRESCDFDLDRRLDTEGIAILLPEIQKMRELARILRLRCRLRLAEGKLDEALNDVQLGFAMARHVGQGSTLIQVLVGFAIHAIFQNELEQIIQHPEAPNLYWSLTALPTPFFEMQRVIQGEIRSIDASLPALREVDRGPLSVEEARRIFERWSNESRVILQGSTAAAWTQQRFFLAAYAVFQYPQARQQLLAVGRTPAELDSMPAAQVLMLDSVIRFRSLRDEVFLWFGKPVPEGREGLKRINQRVQEWQNTRKFDLVGVSLVMLLPAVDKVYDARIRQERRLAALRTIEAIRLHAFGNDGQLPARLAEIKAVPVPVDPLTGKPFGYVVKDGTASLQAFPPEGEQPHLGNSFRYEIRITK